MTTQTIKVIESKVGIDVTGQKVSPFCASAIRIENTGRYTWELNDDGRKTIGMGRMPVDTIEEANKIAQKCFEVTGREVIYD